MKQAQSPSQCSQYSKIPVSHSPFHRRSLSSPSPLSPLENLWRLYSIPIPSHPTAGSNSSLLMSIRQMYPFPPLVPYQCLAFHIFPACNVWLANGKEFDYQPKMWARFQELQARWHFYKRRPSLVVAVLRQRHLHHTVVRFGAETSIQRYIYVRPANHRQRKMHWVVMVADDGLHPFLRADHKTQK